MRALGGIPSRLFAQLSLLAAWSGALWHFRGEFGGHGYTLWPVSANAAACLHDSAIAALPPALVLWALLHLPWRQALRSARPRVWLSRTWALVPAVALWAAWGYGFNRFREAAAWKRRVEIAGLSLPEAMTDPAILGRNLLATLLAVVGAWLLSSLLLRALPEGSRDSRLRPGAGLVLLGFLPLVALAVVPPQSYRSSGEMPDIILISLDATRADHFGVYGDDRGITPSSDAFARSAEIFDRAYAPEPWTLTSHMTMLTGLYPDAHGLDFGRALPPPVWTVAERLRDAGYRTRASVRDCFLLSPRFGYAAGFDEYHESDEAAAERCTNEAEWLLSGRRPAFLFLHLYDPHSDTGRLPYEAGGEALERFASGAREAFRGWAGPDGASETLRQLNEAGGQLEPELQTALRELYAAGLWETDRALGSFFQSLAQAGRLEDALIVLTADHGEALGERGHFMHERHMEATLRIPLFIHWPEGSHAARRRDEIVELVDLAPTLLGVAGLAQEENVQGRRLDRDRPSPRRFAFHRSGPEYAISTTDRWRLVYRREPDIYGTSLRRIDGTPGDGADVLEDSLAFVERWKPAIEEMHRANELLAARFRGGRAVVMSEQDEEMLRSLGYID